jgi:hypothetical protein
VKLRSVTWLIAAGIGLIALGVFPKSSIGSLPASFPDVVLWAWESKQDLRFLPPRTVGIAFLERTVWLHPQGVRSLPRTQPVLYTPGTPMIATVRLEVDHVGGVGLPPAHDAAIAAAEAARMPGLSALQIDFDARLSERVWYLEFLREIRRIVSKSLPITITALESWCEEGRSWLDRAPLSDATPMLFRMGVEENRAPQKFPVAACNASVGISTDEMPERIPRMANRVYIFHPGPWTEPAYESAMDRVRAWRARR